MTHRAGILKRIKQAIRREDGTASIEFVILFPALMTLFLSSFEMSVLLLRSVMLDKSLDTTVRELRLGLVDTQTQGALKTTLCNRAPIISNCNSNLLVELTPISTDTWSFPAGNTTCTDQSAEIQPVVNVTFGLANDIMIVRACAKVDPFFAPSKWVLDLAPLDEAGQYAVVAASTFVNEP
ncbi:MULTISPECIES: TadE/TadG family type IV pilus assembly protein [Maritimibacter]|mgnify:CR=1 FL=1|nr:MULTISPECIES: TadE/TadG family type IV pilus assembly protein [Maritimibacter]TYP81654.1 Flp pilus assembly protein TadG [Maritimibacter alkaliphilus HTCC2654]